VAFICLEQQSEWTPNEYTLPIAEALIRAGASVEDAGPLFAVLEHFEYIM
jgi:hypothetical protein